MVEGVLCVPRVHVYATDIRFDHGSSDDSGVYHRVSTVLLHPERLRDGLWTPQLSGFERIDLEAGTYTSKRWSAEQGLPTYKWKSTSDPAVMEWWHQAVDAEIEYRSWAPQ